MVATDRFLKIHGVKWALAAYSLSLVLPALREPRGLSQGVSHIYGIQCLLFVPWVMMYPAWHANWIFYIGLWVYGRKDYFAAFCCCLVSTLLALTALGIHWHAFLRWFNGENAVVFFPFGPRYFIWVTAMVIPTVSAYLRIPRDSDPPEPAPPSCP